MTQRIDPKELLKNNLPLWITYGVAVVPVVLWFVVVGGLTTEVERAENSLKQKSSQLKQLAKRIESKDAENPVYTPKDVEHFQKQKALYQEAIGKLGQVVQSRDAPLEKWFQSEKWKGTSIEEVTPDFADYQVVYNTQVEGLKTTYKALLRDPSMVYAGEGISSDKMVRFQKRFWVQQACLEALKTGGAKELAAKIDFPEATAAGGAEEKDRPYTPVPVRLAFLASFRDLPRVIHALLTQEIAFRITQLVVEKSPFGIERKETVTFSIQSPEGVFESECYGVKFRDTAPANANDQDAWIPEPSVKVDVSLEALDFRPAPKPAPAEGEGEGQEEPR